MNQRGVDVLMKAALAGRPQAYGKIRAESGARCALGYLAEPLNLVFDDSWWAALHVAYGLTYVVQCPQCNKGPMPEVFAIMHLNDTHRWDLLTIARKLGPSEGEP